MNVWKKSVLGAGIAGAILAGAGAVPAQAAEVDSATGQMVGKGVAVTGTYTVDCDFVGQRLAASINVVQNFKGGRINDNSTQQESVCETDGLVTREYTIFATENAYKPGAAAVRVGVFYSDESGNYTGIEDIEAFAIKLRPSK